VCTWRGWPRNSGPFPKCWTKCATKKRATFLKTFPFEIKVAEPEPQDVQHVADFARKTGDFPSLSVVDLKVLALTYMFEKELNGTEHLRTEPAPPIKPHRRRRKRPATNETGEPAKKSDEETEERQTESSEPDFADASTRAAEALNDGNHGTERGESKRNDALPAQEQKEEGKDTEPQLEERTQEEATDECDAKTERVLGGSESQDDIEVEKEPPATSEEMNAELASADSDDEGWITPDNIHTFDKKVESDTTESIGVGCITTDYAMQNVLLQMGLKLLSVDGIVIKKLRLYVLWCHSCYKTTKEMSRLFCSHCGNSTLMKVAYTIDDNGKLILHNRNKKINLRGTKYSIPKRKGGRHKDLVLREDQLHHGRRRNKEQDPFHADFQFLEPRKMAPKETVVGFGRKNPNTSKKRTGKRKKKTRR